MCETEKIVRDELAKILGKDTDQISSDANLIEEVGLDSLNVLEIFGMVEEKFNVVVDPEKISELKTIKDIVNIIEENKKNRRTYLNCLLPTSQIFQSFSPVKALNT